MSLRRSPERLTIRVNPRRGVGRRIAAGARPAVCQIADRTDGPKVTFPIFDDRPRGLDILFQPASLHSVKCGELSAV
jgi:hypothetical protein